MDSYWMWRSSVFVGLQAYRQGPPSATYISTTWSRPLWDQHGKSMFRLLWDVALVDLAKLLGFKSLKAQAACQNASDHHKSWQILQIFLFGTADELLLSYVRHCARHACHPSVQGYYGWSMDVQDPNYLFMKEVVFTYLFALHLYRAASGVTTPVLW